MSDFNDLWIDEQLRDVPLPAELLPRLREIAALGDREIDHLLSDVAMPPGLADRLHAIGSLTDTDIDDDARHVAVPPTLVPRLRRDVRHQAHYSQLARLAIAATLLVALGGAGWLLVSRLRPEDDPIAAKKNAPSMIADQRSDPAKSPERTTTPPAEPRIVHAATPHVAEPHQEQPSSPPASESVAVSPPTPINDPETIESSLPDNRPEPAPPIMFADVLGNNALVTQPNLRIARGLARQGVVGPRIKGYDLLFEFNKGEHPAVHPGAAPPLAESRAPVWTETSSYEWTRRALAARQPLPASQVRAEDFLAAMDYDFPPPTSAAIGIRTAAGPSPLGPAGMNMVQIGVQARRSDRSNDAGTNLTLAIDASGTMAAGQRWPAVQRALADLIDQLGPRDRLSIVVFTDRPTVLVRLGGRQELRAALAQLEAIEPHGLPDLSAALTMAGGVALQNAASARLVLLTSGIGWIDSAAIPRVVKSLKETAAAGIRFRVVDVRPDEVDDPRLEELARAAGRADDSEVRHAPTRRAIARELHEALAGRHDVAAAAVSIKVKFNPDAIESYRLVGHDPLAGGGLVSGLVEGDLCSGEATTALYEVELKPEGPDAVATVEVSWHEPGTEEVRHLKQTIGRLQFAPSWTEAPLSLQLSTLAVETAAILRGSSFAPTGARPLDQVAELADRANPLLQTRESFLELRSLLDMARAARPSGR
jgi:Ca-activated chloride channel homolog